MTKIKGKVIKVQRELFTVDVGQIIVAKAKGAFRQGGNTPYVGDWVEIRMSPDEDLGLIEKIYPRKNQLLRPPVVNVDQLLIIVSIKSPDLHLNLLDKYLLMAEKSIVEPILVFNKTDLVKQKEVDFLVGIYNSAGFSVYSNNQNQVNDELKKVFDHRTTAVAGPSGAGKSTLLNSLFNLSLVTGRVSEKTQRGKQTTRHIEIFKIGEESYVLDTPGFSSLSLDFIEDESEIKMYFPEFLKYPCRFDDCNHIKEPGCGVKKALELGKIAPSRYESYLQFYKEMSENRRNKW